MPRFTTLAISLAITAISLADLHSSCLAQDTDAISKSQVPKSYSATEITFPGSESSMASGINNNGDVVGGYFSGSIMYAFAHVDGKYHSIDGTKATSINDDQVVVGFKDAVRGFHQPFRWTLENGCDRDFMSRAPSSLGRAMHINNKGQIAVQGRDRGPIGLRCNPNGTVDAMGGTIDGYFIKFPALPAVISEKGAIIGAMQTGDNVEHQVIWFEGKYKTIPEVAQRDGFLIDINSNHDVVGEMTNDKSQTVAFFWNQKEVELLGTFGGRKSGALAVSDLGVVVGYAANQNEQDHGFVWIDGDMQDLNLLVELEDGWVIEEANDVNNKGQISAVARKGTKYKGLLLTPNRK